MNILKILFFFKNHIYVKIPSYFFMLKDFLNNLLIFIFIILKNFFLDYT